MRVNAGKFGFLQKTRQCEILIYNQNTFVGCLAQLARASALHAEGQGFESLNIHHRLVVCKLPGVVGQFFILFICNQGFYCYNTFRFGWLAQLARASR